MLNLPPMIPLSAWTSYVSRWQRAKIRWYASRFASKLARDDQQVRDTAAAYRQSLQDYFFFLGYISLALALLNLLPILPLDGGHIVMSLLERIRGRAFSQLAYLRYSAIGFALFAFLLYLGLRNDLFSGGS